MSNKRTWDVFVVNHSHIDIGYTDRQEVIANYHHQFMRQALRGVRQNESRTPGKERFRFTCEGFYQVEQFLDQSSEIGKNTLANAVRQGDIEITAGYFHLTELLDQGHLSDSLKPSLCYGETIDKPINVAMSCDVNGFSWGFSQALYDSGVRYLCTNINPHHGGSPLGGPMRPFFWETPKGDRVLVWSGLAYHRANMLGLYPGFNPISEPNVPGVVLPGPGWRDVTDISYAEQQLPSLLEQLENMGYPHDFLMLAGSAVYVDNSPVSDGHIALFDAWNEKHGDRIRLHAATLGEFFAHIEKRADQFPTFRGDWTDWWSEGVASAPRDTLLFRNAQRTKRLVEKLDPKHEMVKPEELAKIERPIRFYAEHTFGYSDPLQWNVLYQQLFSRKSRFALEADELAGAALLKVTRILGDLDFEAKRPLSFKVINPHDRPYAGIAKLAVDFWETPPLDKGLKVIDEGGNEVPSQAIPSSRGRFVLVAVELGPKATCKFQIVPATVEQAPAAPEADFFANRFYRARWELPRGIVSLADLKTGDETLDSTDYAMGMPVHQVFPGVVRGEVASARIKDIHDTALLAHPAKRHVNPEAFPDVVRSGRCVKIERVFDGPVFTRMDFHYEVPGASKCVLQATFYRQLPQIDLTLSVLKDNVLDPEGMYCAFPFSIQGGAWYLDKPGGPIRPGVDQLPGSCRDYYLVQAGASLVGEHLAIALSSPDAAMVQVGALRLWTYATEIEPKGTLFSWLTNNKWETNFLAVTGGPYEFRYTIEVGDSFVEPNNAIAKTDDHTLPFIVIRS